MKVCAVQLNLKHCANLQSFINYLEDQVLRQFDEMPDLIVFPENINYCLLFAKEEKITSKSFRSKFEEIFDSVISKINLSFLFNFINTNNQKNIIISAFSYLSKKYNVHIISGTFYDREKDGVYNKQLVFDNFGNIIGTGYKNKLVGFEKSLRIKSCIIPTVINSSLGKIGLCICFDVNYPEYIAEFSCDLLVCPSNGWRLFPGYPYDPKKEKPHRNRALENKIYIARPYCAGWMFPLYFQGHTEIVDKNGAVLSAAKTNNKTELVIADISMEDEQLLPINQD